ncbi:MAG TPA: tRNA (N(6)-L-threonylcarbamoyladenosine(37)-C(2))-methylthiotransferase MtaB, partial [Xanthobacteraceae bacterium]|nr:tRNA (N(6)-L-threonylcarbamoyladenosine(37)-C(2))-methylthiotransferase MtaB [Xanthobacteraceae bacterium]
PQVARAVVKDRARRLRQKGAAVLARHLMATVGAVRRVLMESPQTGHTEQFFAVRASSPLPPGSIVDLPICGHDGQKLHADTGGA